MPQQMAWVVERFGRFDKILEPGLRLLIPMVDRISYVFSLKEEAISVPSQVRALPVRPLRPRWPVPHATTRLEPPGTTLHARRPRPRRASDCFGRSCVCRRPSRETT